jgi:phage tail-like protein
MGLIDKSVPRLTTSSGGGSTSFLGKLATAAGGKISRGIASGALSALQSASGMRFDPAPAYLFAVDISGILAALFTECSGMSMRRDVKLVQEGGVNDHVHKLPGPVSFDNVVLKRGLSLSRSLWDWMRVGQYDFRVQRTNITIIQGAPGHNLGAAMLEAADMGSSMLGKILGPGYGIVKSWTLEDAYPVRWKMSTLDVSSGESVIETLEIAHHGLSLSYEVLTPMSITAGITSLFTS